MEWKANKWLKAALAGGEGSNQGYFASSVDAETQKLAFKTSYVLTGDRFQRVTVISPMGSEVEKGNVQMLYKPNQFFSITAGHENILEPLTVGGPMQQASVNQLSTDFHIEKFYFGSGLFSSNASGRRAQGENFYLGRRFGQRLEVNTNYFESQPQSARNFASNPRRKDDYSFLLCAGEFLLALQPAATGLTHGRANHLRLWRRLHQQSLSGAGGL